MKVSIFFWKFSFENSIPRARIFSVSHSSVSNLSIASFRASGVCGEKNIPVSPSMTDSVPPHRP